jgi:hypothetical protein
METKPRQNIKDRLIRLAEGKNYFDVSVQQLIKDIETSGKKVVNPILNYVPENIENAINGVSEFVGDQVQTISKLPTQLPTIDNVPLDNITDIGQEAVGMIKDASFDIVNSVDTTNVVNAVNSINPIDSPNELKYVGNEFVDSLNDVGEIGQDVGREFVDSVGDVGELGKDLGSDVLDVTTDIGSDLLYVGKEVGEGTLNVGKSVGSDLLSVGEGTLNVGKSVGSDLLYVGKNVGEGTLSVGKNVFTDLWELLKVVLSYGYYYGKILLSYLYEVFKYVLAISIAIFKWNPTVFVILVCVIVLYFLMKNVQKKTKN